VIGTLLARKAPALSRSPLPEPQASWPESWRVSYHFDQLEVYGSRRHLGYSYGYSVRRRRILDFISAVALPGDRILDVAGAQGNFSIALAQLGYAVTWNDIRHDLIDFVKMKYPGQGIEFRPGNLFELECTQQYDVALVAEVIEHVAHPDQFLARIAEFVRPGGYVVLTTPNGRYIRNRLPRFSDCTDFARLESSQFGPDAADHIFLLHPDEIHTLAETSGLEVVKLELFTNPLTTGYAGTEPLLRVLPRGVVELIERTSQRFPRGISERLNTQVAVLLRKPR
jgi:2-polyprenyl-3-methyl-5-hydroxy-6-metoxy-1,4-benzoquinol methylase